MVVEFPDNLNIDNEEHSKSIEYTTINRMELTAVLEAIVYAKDKSRELSIQRVMEINLMGEKCVPIFYQSNHCSVRPKF